MELREIKRIVEETTNIDLLEKKQKRDNVYARALYCKIAKEKTDSTLKEIGELINKDHSTVLYAITKIFEEIEFCEPRLASIYKSIIGNDYFKSMEEKYIDMLEENEQLKLELAKLQQFRNKFKLPFKNIKS
tara:strand:- start:2034 stop:2429 length:396 start_codon:yes stop_codon:yes gene_type:complete